MADGTSYDFDDDFVDASDFDRRRDTEDTGDDEGQEESTDDEDPGPQVKTFRVLIIWTSRKLTGRSVFVQVFNIHKTALQDQYQALSGGWHLQS